MEGSEVPVTFSGSEGDYTRELLCENAKTVLTTIPTRVIIWPDAKYACCEETVSKKNPDIRTFEYADNIAAECRACGMIISEIIIHCEGKREEEHRKLRNKAAEFAKELSTLIAELGVDMRNQHYGTFLDSS